MSLNWDAHDAPNWDKVKGYKADEIIFATIPLGINRITTDNYREMYSRYLKLCLIKGWEPTLELVDFHSAIGLHTNASSKTPTKFGKDLLFEMDELVKVKIRVEEEVG